MRRKNRLGLKLLAPTTIALVCAGSGCVVDSDPGDRMGDQQPDVAGKANGVNHAFSQPVEKFAFVSMTPAPESKIATPLSSIELRFNRAVDPSTLGGVVLRERESLREVPSTVTANGVFVTIVPQRPLASMYRYTVDVDQIEAQSPFTLPIDVTKRFFTAPNHPDLYIRYQNGVAVRTHDYDWYPASGDLRIYHLIQGEDGILQTADDVQDSWSLVHYNAEHDNVYSLVRGYPGPDGVHGTSDDEHLYERIMSHDGRGEVTRDHNFFGDDMQVGTADDYALGKQVRVYDAQDRLVSLCDGSTCTEWIHLVGERITLTHISAGPDAQWLTSDDELDPTWHRNIYNAVGVEARSEVHALATDGTPTPSASTLQSYTNVMLTVEGLAANYSTFTDPGADGIWDTADDVADTYSDIVYDADGMRVTRDDFDAGPDGQIGTTDDLIASEWTY